jgi:SSS family solute:Na+ symporter
MHLNAFDIIAFLLFMAVVIGISLYFSRREETGEDYFLAGRGLTWWLIGFSLIASNISTEHFVGMAGKGFGGVGLAIASYEWIAAITMVIVAWYFLPKFLRSGIFTMPEFLEYRFSRTARSIMAFYLMVAYVVVAMTTVLYSGAIALKALFGLDLVAGIWLIGLIAGAYTTYGGLKAVVWTDLFQGAALLLGGLLVTVIGFGAIGGVGRFLEVGGPKLHVLLPADHPELPWTILIGGIWVPNFFYWGLNQFITQRTLGSKSLAEGQRGIVFAALLKLIIPFIIVFPGIMAFELYGSQITDANQAYPFLIKNLLPDGLTGIMFAALFGAVLSSLDSMLNSASTIFTIDLYKQHINPEVSPHRMVAIGRIATVVFVLIACLWAPLLEHIPSVFDYIQMFWGFISPGILCVFLFGLFVKRTPPAAAVATLLLSLPVYGFFLWRAPFSYTNNMGYAFLVLAIVTAVFTLLRPLARPVELPQRVSLDLTPARRIKLYGSLVIAATVALYVIFR